MDKRCYTLVIKMLPASGYLKNAMYMYYLTLVHSEWEVTKHWSYQVSLLESCKSFSSMYVTPMK